MEAPRRGREKRKRRAEFRRAAIRKVEVLSCTSRRGPSAPASLRYDLILVTIVWFGPTEKPGGITPFGK
jgi:hypothetical protein